MNRIARRLACTILLALLIPAIPITASAEPLLVGVDWLSERLDDERLVLLHVGRQETFDGGHIPGAQRVGAHMEFSHPDSHGHDGLVLELPEVESLESTLARLGVTEDSRIVVYFSDGQLTQATRVVFTLDWAGLGGRTVLLDGGLGAWKRSGYPVTREVTKPAPGKIALALRSDLVVDAAWVRAHAKAGGHHVLDARSRAFYDGVRESGGRKGHIPGAGALPWTELVDENLEFHDPATLEQALREAGVDADDTVVSYCHIGQFATTVLFAARLIGHEIRLYDGAFQDWAERDLPVTSGEYGWMKARPYANPYLVGVGIGAVLLLAFLVAGRGLGATGAYSTVVAASVAAAAPEHTVGNPAYQAFLNRPLLGDWLVVQIIGVLVGGLLSAMAAGRIRPALERGPRAGRVARLATAFGGGILLGLGAKFARGCTSGQGLTGGAMYSAGAWLFIAVAFATAYLLAPVVRRQWT